MIKRFVLFIIAIGLSYVVNSQIDVLADTQMEVQIDGDNIFLPLYYTHDLTEENTEIKRAIVVVHGTNRNADDYFDNMRAALALRPELVNETLVIAPQFLREDDVDAFGLGDRYIYWSSDGWKVGANSKNESSHPRDYRVPSYEMLDTLIMRLPHTFPNLENLVFTGHSAGGQLTNRYTASSPVFDLLCSDFSISSKSVIANPGTYVYMSPKRRVSGTLDEFEVPTGCDEYNKYSYGLEDLYTYHNRSGAQQMLDWYQNREVIYLLGENDNDPDATTLPRSCRAMLEGNHRLERGLIYYNHIVETFGEEVKNKHQLITVPRVGHNNQQMYQSEEGLRVLFDELPLTTCNNQTTSVQDLSVIGYSLYPNPAQNEIHLQIDNKKNNSIIIYDVQGNRQIVNTQGLKTKNIDISNLKPGIHILQVSIENEIFISRFIKL